MRLNLDSLPPRIVIDMNEMRNEQFIDIIPEYKFNNWLQNGQTIRDIKELIALEQEEGTAFFSKLADVDRFQSRKDPDKFVIKLAIEPIWESRFDFYEDVEGIEFSITERNLNTVCRYSNVLKYLTNDEKSIYEHRIRMLNPNFEEQRNYLKFQQHVKNILEPQKGMQIKLSDNDFDIIWRYFVTKF
jgi:hypothetical protein